MSDAIHGRETEAPAVQLTESETRRGQNRSAQHEGRTAAVNAAFFLLHLKPGMTVLDLGCGTGTITVGLAEAVAPGQVVGIDADPQRIETAESRLRDLGIANLTYQLADVYKLPFASDTFDAALAHCFLMHLDDPVGASQAVLRVLKPGGCIGTNDTANHGIMISAPTPELSEWFDWSMALYRDWRKSAGTNLMFGMEIRRTLSRAGFVDVAATATSHTWGTDDELRRVCQYQSTFHADHEFIDWAASANRATPEQMEQARLKYLEWAEHPNISESLCYNPNFNAVGWKPQTG